MNNEDNIKLWKDVLLLLKPKMRETDFVMYMRSTTIMEKNDKSIIIGFPNETAKNTVAARYHEQLLSSVKDIVSYIDVVDYEVDINLSNKSDSRIISMDKIIKDYSINNRKETNIGVQVTENIRSRKINDKYNFDSFVVGSGNRLAFTVANNVVDAPGKDYNPLFIWGGVGLGKTHLLQACANSLNKKKNFKVAYITAEQWFNDYINAVKTRTNNKFHKSWREIDCLIFDDVQTIAKNEGTQNEFFHTFNTLYENNKQIIIAADRHPRDLNGFTDRLLSRFASGMVVQIEMPDFETRYAIIQNRISEEGVVLPSDIISLIAENNFSSIRELEGVVTQLIARMRTFNIEPNFDTVIAIIGNGVSIGSSNNNAMFERSFNSSFGGSRMDEVSVLASCAIHYNIPERDIRGSSRKKNFLLPRQIAMFIMRDCLSMSLQEIGKIFSRDHTTVIHACEKIKNETLQNPNGKIARDISILRNKIMS